LGQPAPEWLKFELLDRPGGKKKEWTTKQPEKSLFGVQLSEHPLFAKCQHVVLCEGEKDAVAWATYGCNAWGILPVSVPFGAKWKGQDKHRPSPNREWLDRNWDWLQAFETVFVCMDADEGGQRAAADIIAEMGPRRCRLVTLPNGKKDPNDCLLADVPAAAMRAALDTAKDFSPEKVVSAVDLEADFLKWVFEREQESGIAMPFDMPLRLRRREMTLWMGIKGCGKTTLLDFVTVQAMAVGERVLVCSFEMPWQDTNDKLCRQAFGGLYFDHRVLKKCETDTERATYQEVARQQAVATHRWLAKNLWYYVHVGIGKWRQLVDDIRWARRRLGITFVQIDNFMRLGILANDYEQQAEAMICFASLAMDLGIHIVMVIHQTKKEGRDSREEGFGDVHSASGAHQIADNCHNIVEIQRNDKKGKQMSELFDGLKLKVIGQQEFKEKKAALDLKSDGKFVLHAQRNGEVQDGSKNLWFLWESQQYVDVPPGHSEHTARRYAVAVKPKPHYPEKDGLELPTNEELGIGGE
jgi:twinkle protein